ncbi:hypothetical protein P154DRAFT_443843 [Amniculicola lignicola CBS 123094]|uniref:Uncharacterized protein n=1 Tax=Amniculicola lignicola CBS 123094 TaxID=1392246 RepID=A0A6A5W2U3_9PLEO|nr:hypothetical protein P154DRAFT_443843 [Amniculicola lignicola CBS 123094]
MVAPQAVRRVVWTGAIAAVTVTGSLYGAGLKSQIEFKGEKKRVIEATLEEKITSLENVRAGLITRKIELERKMDRFTARRLLQKAEEERKTK